MVFNRLIGNGAPVIRNFSTSLARNSHDTRGIVGSNLPFQIDNKYRLGLTFLLFFASGLGLPFLSLRSAILADKSD